MALFDTINEQLELGPASEIASSTTAGSGNSGYTMKGSGTSWDQFVRAGDMVVIDPTETAASAHVLEVVSATELTLDTAIAADSTDFQILRPTEAFIRPHIEWQWEIHGIVASPRINASVEDLGVWPVEVWATDDSYPRTLLLVSDATDGLNRVDLLLKPTYFNWLLIRNYQLVRVDLAITGIDKTIIHE
jgi:hypothetical protein